MLQRQKLAIFVKVVTILSVLVTVVGVWGLYLVMSTPGSSHIGKELTKLIEPGVILAIVNAVLLRRLRGKNDLSTGVIGGAILITIVGIIFMAIFIYGLSTWQPG